MSAFAMFKSILRLGLASAASLMPLLTCAAAAEAKPLVMSGTISVGEVKAAQEAWCNALVSTAKPTTRED